MIQYTLKCGNDHRFDSWFASSAAYDSLAASGHLVCEICGSGEIEKAMMMPRVVTKRDATQIAAPQGHAPQSEVTEDQAAEAQAKAAPEAKAPTLRDPGNEAEQALAAFKRKVEQTSDYVGDSFAKQARAMHLGETPERSIYGQANLQEAKALVEDGIPVMPLPFRPTRKAN